jgi:GNAT superfamily N-acetyltransferase
VSATRPTVRPVAMPAATSRPLQDDCPGWGRVVIIPWDTDIFGFPVAAYEPGDPGVVGAGLEAFRRRFREWTAAHEVELVACTVGAGDRAWQALLPELGFAWVEQTLRLRCRLQSFDAPPPSRPVRLATPDDRPQVEEIAGHAFRHGRYHADPRFPSDLADRRYRQWVRSAATDPAGRVYVVGDPGSIKGFFQVIVKGDRAEIGIMAVAEAAQGTPVAADLVTGIHLDLKAAGLRWITAKVSATNVRVMNLGIDFGYRFRDPEVTFHWHSPDARHLGSEGRIVG